MSAKASSCRASSEPSFTSSRLAERVEATYDARLGPSPSGRKGARPGGLQRVGLLRPGRVVLALLLTALSDVGAHQAVEVALDAAGGDHLHLVGIAADEHVAAELRPRLQGLGGLTHRVELGQAKGEL